METEDLHTSPVNELLTLNTAPEHARYTRADDIPERLSPSNQSPIGSPTIAWVCTEKQRIDSYQGIQGVHYGNDVETST